MKNIRVHPCLSVVALLLLCGCVVRRPHLVEINRDTNGTINLRDMRLTSFALWPASQTIDKERAAMGKTLSVGTTMLDQQTGGTNMVEALRYLDSILGKFK